MPIVADHGFKYHARGGHGINLNISDTDDAADTKYFGFVDQHGGWMIMKEVTSAGTFRYRMGRSGYTTAWTGRAAGAAYDYLFDLF